MMTLKVDHVCHWRVQYELKSKAKRYLKAKKWNKAHRALCNLRRYIPNDNKLFVKLGDVEMELNNLSAAKYYYQIAIKLNAWNSTAWNKLGSVHFDLDKLSDAESYYLQALKTATTDNAKNLSNFNLGTYSMHIPLE